MDQAPSSAVDDRLGHLHCGEAPRAVNTAWGAGCVKPTAWGPGITPHDATTATSTISYQALGPTPDTTDLDCFVWFDTATQVSVRCDHDNATAEEIAAALENAAKSLRLGAAEQLQRAA